MGRTHARPSPGFSWYGARDGRGPEAQETSMTKSNPHKPNGQAPRKPRARASAASTVGTPPVSPEQDIAAGKPEPAEAASQMLGKAPVAADQRPTATQQGAAGRGDRQPPRRTKSALLREMVRAPDGASLTDLIAATGWQAHTIRAALTGLRRKGLVLERRRVGDATIYRSVGEASDVGPAATEPGGREGWNRGDRGMDSTGEGTGEAGASSSPAAVSAP